MEEKPKINIRALINRNLIVVLRWIKADPKNMELALKMADMNATPNVVVVKKTKKRKIVHLLI